MIPVGSRESARLRTAEAAANKKEKFNGLTYPDCAPAL